MLLWSFRTTILFFTGWYRSSLILVHYINFYMNYFTRDIASFKKKNQCTNTKKKNKNMFLKIVNDLLVIGFIKLHYIWPTSISLLDEFDCEILSQD